MFRTYDLFDDHAARYSGQPIRSPFQHLQPATRVQFGLGAVLQYSSTPSLRLAGFEDEDDDEYENEPPCEGESPPRFPAPKGPGYDL
ncbi:MAG TPA: hypothetical protein VE641_08840 [Chthoniobacterales bacterium]|nr:hypothetical protein [Chthoniobacterales bacterium]